MTRSTLLDFEGVWELPNATSTLFRIAVARNRPVVSAVVLPPVMKTEVKIAISDVRYAKGALSFTSFCPPTKWTVRQLLRVEDENTLLCQHAMTEIWHRTRGSGESKQRASEKLFSMYGTWKPSDSPLLFSVVPTRDGVAVNVVTARPQEFVEITDAKTSGELISFICTSRYPFDWPGYAPCWSEYRELRLKDDRTITCTITTLEYWRRRREYPLYLNGATRKHRPKLPVNCLPKRPFFEKPHR